jgi:hypothetical protein
MEAYPIADPELQHLQMCAHLVEESEARDDAMIKLDEFGLR